jgi:CheY-like chemotaxis protein
MPTKVLVFESDPAFAGELRGELDALGCVTTVVDDGNLGLQQAASDRPDLILLAIELPRMNGFSVCNKLKKDPNLKDVPLIIMSTESSDETFDQHKKLRTRAEDYVHKPLAFGELLQRIQPFVPLAPPPQDDAAIVIEDEIEVGASDYLMEEEGPPPAEPEQSSPRLASTRPSRPTRSGPSSGPPPVPDVPAAMIPSVRPAAGVDAEVDAFAESAFDRLTDFDSGGEAPTGNRDSLSASAFGPAPGSNAGPTSVPSTPPQPWGPANGAALEPPSSVRTSMPPIASRSSRPPASGVDVVEHERVKAELMVARERAEASEAELSEARREIDRLRLEAGDVARLTRDADELRAKLAATAKAGGISSRDFLDLREALNKKDKDILAFREQLSKKDREIVEAQDRALGLERGRADLEERLLGVERELAEAKERVDVLAADKDLAKKNAEDLRGRLDRAKSDAEGRERQLSELRARMADERAAAEVRFASIRAELDQVLANERAENARALDEAEQRRRIEVDQVRRERDATLAELRDQADRALREALEIQLHELRQDQESKLNAAQRLHQQELDRARSESGERERAAIESLRAQQAEDIRALTEARDARIAEVEAQATREAAQAAERAAQTAAELSSVREELRQLAERKQADDAASSSRITELEQHLTEVYSAREAMEQRLGEISERLASTEAQLEAAQRELSDGRERLAGELSRAEQNRVKSDADRRSLERAKDALAVALAQIEETETRPQP